jgi:hypothetical protein
MDLSAAKNERALGFGKIWPFFPEEEVLRLKEAINYKANFYK